MAEAQSFSPVKLICGVMAPHPEVIRESQERLTGIFDTIDSESREFDFDFTDYYSKQMGGSLKRKFFSFLKLISPEDLSDIKIHTNELEKEIQKKRREPGRIVNIDPGFLNGAAVVMGTVKDFAHRIPLQRGIYGHLELLFGKHSVKILEWTYPDFHSPAYHEYFLRVRKIYLQQLKQNRSLL